VLQLIVGDNLLRKNTAVCYDKATAPTSGPQKGSMALYRALVDSKQWGSQTKGLGVYNNRPIRNGKSLSTHAEGRALDIGVPVSSDTGDRLYRVMVENATELGVQQILWDGKGWRCDRGQFSTSSKVAALHRDHLHIELTRDASHNLKPSQVAKILGQPIPEPNVILQEGDKSSAVASIQAELNKFGYQLKVDGDYGPMTRRAVEDYQRKHGLTPDGIVGPITRKAMKERKPMGSVTKSEEVFFERPPSMVPNPAPTETQRVPVERITVKRPAPPKPQQTYTKTDLTNAVNQALDRQLQVLMDAMRAARNDKG